MRTLTLLLVLATLTACSSSRRAPTDPSAPRNSTASPVAGAASSTPVASPFAKNEVNADGIPRVVRRILAEEKELVEHSLVLATELPDPRGRERALAEGNDLARELAQIEAPLEGADSERLDEIVTKLIRLDTRIALLHESLRTATNRTTAVLVE